MFIKSPTTDLIIVLVIVLLIFGPKRLPGLGRQLGQGMREFKDSITGSSKDDEPESRPELTPAAAAPAAATPVAASHAAASPAEPVPTQRESAEIGSQRPA